MVSYRLATRAGLNGLVHGLSWTGLAAPTTPWQRTTVSDLPAILDAILWRVVAADCKSFKYIWQASCLVLYRSALGRVWSTILVLR
ncbi:hypothetical protein TIFTF001_044621 [Ficus carica]|uniref:Uncharacterized protein n=1 Tax=Ficus carica TaxID=3494 RepID=A0AA88CRA8_FICCA|nr:hypothetical protein TIFTF001_044615 [Ficus carica]GMN31737.1 hypothetical protein TIFTF001_044617 [Ficus carica]GMN31748.1 hypothetical protein TIFTF001_044619 [Ficus carica]GMN31770.1 hypothetical protein TIFTF001_044621 [Ficus carica]